MYKTTWLTALVFFCASISFAQETSTNPNDSKKRNHYVGLQANQLLKQLLNFGGNANSDNPFLMKYAYRLNDTGNEITAGLGLQTESSNGNNGLKTDMLDLSFRLGYSKKTMLSKRFELGYGIDAVMLKLDSKSESGSSGGFSNNISKTETNNASYGGGPQLNFAFYVHDRIKLGTEATYYFLYKEEKFSSTTETSFFDFNGELQTQTISSSENNFGTSFDFTVPVAVFLIVKL